MNRSLYSRKEKSAGLLLLLANILFMLALWLEQNYDQISFDQFLFQLKSTSTGVNSDLLQSAIVHVGLLSLGLTALEVWIYCLFTNEQTGRSLLLVDSSAGAHLAFVSRTRKYVLAFACALLTISLLVCGLQIRLFSFVKADSMHSDFIENHYVEPDGSLLHFPEQNRNLIYIFLESMESTFADPDAGEVITACYIPELEQLASHNLNFSHNAGLGGALSYPGTTWTAAAMVAQTAGVPVKMSLEADTYGAEDSFLPGAVSIGQILREQGYNQELLLGSNAEFHGREVYFTEHGNYKILDTDALKEADRLPQDYEAWWGFEDEKLFELACSSRQVADFVSWIQEQPFYENTTVVISGDHLTMDAGFMEEIDPDYTRSVYNCFIHSAATPSKEKNRLFGTFDLFPTTLAALGAEIDGDRLGLGTNLFSDRKTLTEQFGYEYLTEELQKQSAFYNAELLRIEE